LPELDLSFHSGIAAASKNPVLAQVFENVLEHVAQFVRKTQEMPNSRERAYNSHAQILNAIKERNPEKARPLMREPVCVSKEAFELLFGASREQPQFHEHTMVGGQAD
jgi:DNA-binding FadR family transcriptional regulator